MRAFERHIHIIIYNSQFAAFAHGIPLHSEGEDNNPAKRKTSGQESRLRPARNCLVSRDLFLSMQGTFALSIHPGSTNRECRLYGPSSPTALCMHRSSVGRAYIAAPHTYRCHFRGKSSFSAVALAARSMLSSSGASSAFPYRRSSAVCRMQSQSPGFFGSTGPWQ